MASHESYTQGVLRCRRPDGQVDQPTKQATEFALRLAALPADGLCDNLQGLDVIDNLAMRVLGRRRISGDLVRDRRVDQ
jgi:hypothetical protein